MDLKREYLSIVENLMKGARKAGVKLTKQEIAERLGYARGYFSTLTGKGGVITQRHIEHIKREFESELTGNYYIAPSGEDLQDKALLKVLTHNVAKLEAKVFNRNVADCLDDIEQNTILVLKDLLK